MDTKKSEDTRIGYEWIALSVTTIGALMAAIDASAVIIALPTIMADLQADFITIMWVLLSYMLILAALVPVVGRLADMLGRKNLYNLGFIIFTVGSLLCGLSQPQFHGWDLVGYRMVQGMGGALLLTNSAVIVTDAFRKGRVGFGLGVNGIAFSAGFLLGPVVGGVLTSISWRLVFLINVPIGIIGTIWGILQLREPVTLPKGQRFDWKGSLTFTLGLGGTPSRRVALCLSHDRHRGRVRPLCGGRRKPRFVRRSGTTRSGADAQPAPLRESKLCLRLGC